MRPGLEHVYQRSYRGPVRAVILDWAGTTLDFGCMAPAVVFVEVFARRGVAVTLDEARGPMGTYKKDHIRAMTGMAGVRARWREAHGREPGESDVEAMYQDFIPLQLACLSRHARLIPGTLETVAALRDRGIRIGTTTGYTAEMTAINLRDADAQGYVPDSTVSSSEVAQGRPSPAMCLLNVVRLGASPLAACVKVDDTVPGIEEGLNAAMWTIGLAVSGNEVGLSEEDWRALPAAERGALAARARRRLAQGGAHYVVDTIADLLPCIDDIEARLGRGERP